MIFLAFFFLDLLGHAGEGEFCAGAVGGGGKEVGVVGVHNIKDC